MRVCNKHQQLLNDNIDLNFHFEIISEFNEKLDVESYQDKIEFRKNNCQVCYFGAIGKSNLVKIIKKSDKAKMIML